MSAVIPTTEPAELRAGLTWKWRREDLADYPATTWTLTYWFKQATTGGAKFSVVATADGASFAVSVAAATTAGYAADDYSWVAVVSAGAESYEVDRGFAKLLPKYNADAALDDRSHARKTLEAIEAVIEGRATTDQQEYSIGNRNLKRIPIAELLKFKQFYQAAVQKEINDERIANGQGAGKVVVRL